MSEELLAKIEKATQECREAIRDAHGARRDLTQMMAEVRKFMRTEAEVILSRAVMSHFEQLGKAIKIHMDMSVQKVSNNFKRLEDLFLGTGNDDRKSLEALVREARKRHGLG